MVYIVLYKKRRECHCVRAIWKCVTRLSYYSSIWAIKNGETKRFCIFVFRVVTPAEYGLGLVWASVTTVAWVKVCVITRYHSPLIKSKWETVANKNIAKDIIKATSMTQNTWVSFPCRGEIGLALWRGCTTSPIIRAVSAKTNKM